MDNIRNHFIGTLNADYKTELVTDTQYCLELKKGILTIDFQGSVSFEDWIHNFSFFKRWHHGDLVHSGFLKKWLAVRQFIYDFINKNKHEIDYVITRGHSQGGAIALLAYLDLKRINRLFRPKCITFGAPRVFSVFQKKSEFEKVAQIETRRDIVCRVPLWLMFFKHCGRRVKIGPKSWIDWIPSANAHRPETYLEYMSK